MEKSLRSYFSSYQKRFPEKGVDQAILASRKWISNFIRFVLDGEVPADLAKKIENVLEDLREEGQSDSQQRLV